jgi:hypothetical protein
MEPCVKGEIQLKSSEAMSYLHSLPAPKVAWLDRCLGDKRLTEVFSKGMGYTPEDLVRHSIKEEAIEDENESEEQSEE